MGWSNDKMVIGSMKKNISEKAVLPDFDIDLVGKNSLASKVLFYPCAGNDIFDAISYFYPIIDTFFFCDTNRYNVNYKKIKEILLNFDLTKSIEEYIWRKNTNERPKSRQVVDARDRIAEPSLYTRREARLTQIWKNEKEKREIKIIRVVGDGYKVLTNEEVLKQIGIFFYRGDSDGEGGSGVRWLEITMDRDYCYSESGKHFEIVLQRIVSKGLIVVDGSNCGESYKFLKQYHNSRDLSFSMVDNVTKDGNTFRCLGKISPRYGPTLVWEIDKGNI